MPATAASIKLDNISKSYDTDTHAVSHLSLDIAAGELVALVGPSGCGKSTVLRMINRLLEPTNGTIYIDGENILTTDPVQLRRQIGYVIQNVGLFPHQTITANVATVPKLLGWNKNKVNNRVNELLSLVGLDPSIHGHRYPHQLSGGQRQRVGVARALAADPLVLLMDEPFSAVDPIARGKLQQEFLRLQADVGKTIVFVTHDVDEAILLGDKIAVLSLEAKLEQYGPPADILAHPATDFVADFIGADRGVKRLWITDIKPHELGETPIGNHPKVPATSTLRTALSALLDGDTGYVTVTGDNGDTLGSIDTTGIYRMLVNDTSG